MTTSPRPKPRIPINPKIICHNPESLHPRRTKRSKPSQASTAAKQISAAIQSIGFALPPLRQVLQPKHSKPRKREIKTEHRHQRQKQHRPIERHRQCGSRHHAHRPQIHHAPALMLLAALRRQPAPPEPAKTTKSRPQYALQETPSSTTDPLHASLTSSLSCARFHQLGQRLFAPLHHSFAVMPPHIQRHQPERQLRIIRLFLPQPLHNRSIHLQISTLQLKISPGHVRD